MEILPSPVDACANCGYRFRQHFRRSDSPYCKTCRAAKKKEAAAFPLNKRIPTGTLGAMHELIVCADLMRRGFHVFRAMSQSCPCDIVAYRDAEPIRIEVKTGYRRADNSIAGPYVYPYQQGRFDVRAIVTHDGTITYEPEGVIP